MRSCIFNLISNCYCKRSLTFLEKLGCSHCLVASPCKLEWSDDKHSAFFPQSSIQAGMAKCLLATVLLSLAFTPPTRAKITKREPYQRAVPIHVPKWEHGACCCEQLTCRSSTSPCLAASFVEDCMRRKCSHQPEDGKEKKEFQPCRRPLITDADEESVSFT